ncbi:MAG TPA: glycosyltransferase [Anaerolineae bacterium]|nr:glycosyltransferase [Anaerolineae bacterium]
MLISVVIPTRNRASSLVQTIDALQAQTYPFHEILVVDDGSTDQTATAMQRITGIRYIHQPSRGPAAARNRGSREAQGDILAYTDDDCVPLLTWLEQIAQGYQDYPHVAGIGGPCRAPVDVLCRNRYARYEWAFERGMLPTPAYIHWLTKGQLTWHAQWPGHGDYLGGMDCPTGRTNNISFRRSVFQALGGFDESFPLAAAEDADLKIRLCLQGHCLLWLDSLIVEHRHAYTLGRFCRQHVTYGRGVVHLERKHRGRPTPRLLATLRLVKRLAALPGMMHAAPRRELIWPRAIAQICDVWGQIIR